MQQTSTPVKRQRGGQPGNQNARKYGLYAANVNALDLIRTSAGLPDGYADEISVLRIFMNRVLEQTDVTAGPEHNLAALRAVYRAIYLLNHLIREDRRFAAVPSPTASDPLLGLPLGSIGNLDLFNLLITHAASDPPPTPSVRSSE